MIRPVGIDASGTVTLDCDHCPGPSWTAPATNLAMTAADTIVLGPCPTCGTTSYHPALGDGSIRRMLQFLFIWRLTKAPAVIAAAGTNPVWPVARAALLALVRKQAQAILGETTATPAVNDLVQHLWQSGTAQQGDQVGP